MQIYTFQRKSLVFFYPGEHIHRKKNIIACSQTINPVRALKSMHGSFQIVLRAINPMDEIPCRHKIFCLYRGPGQNR